MKSFHFLIAFILVLYRKKRELSPVFLTIIAIKEYFFGGSSIKGKQSENGFELFSTQEDSLGYTPM